MRAPRITVCICTYNRYELLPKAIDSALAQSLNREEFRVLVIDNSPDHASAEAFGERFQDGDFVQYRVERRPGLSNARNVGTRECGTEFIAFMDDDAIADSNWLKHLLAAFAQFGEQAVVAGGRVEPIWELPRPSWLHDWLLGFVSVVNWGGDTRIAAPHEWFAGTNIAFRTKSLLEFGAFDANLGRVGGGATLLSNEEIQLLNQFRKNGLQGLYVPGALMRHLVERKRLTQTWFRKRVAWQAVSDFMMDPTAAAARVVGAWDQVLDYFFRIPPPQRTVLGFYAEVNDHELFQKQLKAIEIYTLASLAGFDGLGALDHGD
jgi:glycosyltransferase involved in cell wall biosynthesis